MNLIFFDIDGTLLVSKGAGGKSIVKVMKQTFNVQEEIARIEIHGQTDRGIASQLFSAHEIEDSQSNFDTFTECYLGTLEKELEDSDGTLLPGIPVLLDRLVQSKKAELALLTGNIKAGAFKKIRHFGIEQYFHWGGFGDRHRDRADVAKEAMKTAIDNVDTKKVEQVFVIGDTPNDIRCGKAIDATTIGVATAIYSANQLSQHSPDYVLEDLSDVDRVVSILTS